MANVTPLFTGFGANPTETLAFLKSRPAYTRSLTPWA